MKKLKKKNIKFRNYIYKKELYRSILKSLILNHNFNFLIRIFASNFLNNLIIFSVKNRLFYKCIVTNRKANIYSKFKFSRILLLSYIRECSLNGFKKL